MRISIRIIWLALATLAVAAPAPAQQSEAAAGLRRFDVYGYAIEGRNARNDVDVVPAAAPLLGRGRTAAEVERARSAIEQTYHDVGHCAVRVSLPQPEPRDGVVTFVVGEAPAGGVRECLPMLARDAPRTGAATVARATAAAGGTAPAVAAAGGQAPAAAPAPVAQANGAAPAAVPVAAAAPAFAHTPRSDDVHAGAMAMPYIEGAGKRGLILASESVVPAAVVAMPTTAVAAAPAMAAPAEPAAAAPHAAGAPVTPQRLAQADAPKPAQPAQPAEAAPGETLKFTIERFVVEGNTLLSQGKIDRAITPFVGTDRDFGDVQRALEALQLAYQQEGYGGVEIRLPEQELDKGVVMFRVVEPRIARVSVEGNEHFSTANALRSVPGLRVGETPNSRDIAEGIRLANENPAKQQTVILRASEREDHLDAVIRVVDVDPKRWTLSLDNTGNEGTHRYRMGLGFQHANLFDRDHVITGQFVTSPANYHDVYIYGLGYRVPFYSLGDSLEFVGGYSNVDSGTVGTLFTVSGKGAVYALRYHQELPKWGELEQKLSYGLDYRAYQNQVAPVGSTVNLVPDITVHPWSLTYTASTKVLQRDLGFYASLAQNIPGGSDGRDENFKAEGARFEVGTAGYRLLRTGVAYSGEVDNGWQFRVRWDGQFTDDALVAGEQYGIGGADSVRGFAERYTSNDKGYRTSLELYTPDWAKHFRLADGRLRFLAFYDWGHLRRNKTLPGELAAVSLDSTGAGLRLSYRDKFTLRLDFAYVLHDGTQQQEPDGRRSSKKGHFSMAWVW